MFLENKNRRGKKGSDRTEGICQRKCQEEEEEEVGGERMARNRKKELD